MLIKSRYCLKFLTRFGKLANKIFASVLLVTLENSLDYILQRNKDNLNLCEKGVNRHPFLFLF